MATTTQETFNPFLGKKIRITPVTECCGPDYDGQYVVTDGFVSVQLSAEVESGNEIITRKADGSLCVNERMSDAFKRFTVVITLCEVDPCAYSLISNAEPYFDAEDNIIGFTVPEGDITAKFALELWTGLAGEACAEGVDEASGYLLLPCVVGGTLGDLEFNGENAVTFSINGAFTKGGNGWGVGPWDDVTPDGALPTPLDPADHLLLIKENVAPPENTDGCADMPSGSDSTV